MKFAMKIVLAVLVGGVWLRAAIPTAQAAPCLIVTLTGSMGGPPTFNGRKHSRGDRSRKYPPSGELNQFSSFG
jgi:hypothetical protein